MPSHFWLEVVNPLARRHRWDGKELLHAIRELDELDLTTVESDRTHVLLTIDLVRHRDDHEPTPGGAAKETIAWICCGLAFGGVVGVGGDEVAYRDKHLTVNGKPGQSGQILPAGTHEITFRI